jgi:ABC-type sugar transport system ATPase subunit
MAKDIVLEMKGITKAFGNVVVLQDIDFELKRNEVHALVGANGAGKSTLMKILNGILINYKGNVFLEGESVRFTNPVDAARKGVGMIHQELDLTPNLTVAQNIYLGHEIRSKIGVINKQSMENETQRLLDRLKFDVDATILVKDLPPAKQQLVLIARAIGMDSKLIIMDEPTSSLSIGETENLFEVVKTLKDQGISIIYISHFLEEIFKIADRVTVLRDGKKIDTCEVKDVDIPQIVTMMVGKGRDHEKKFCRERPAEEVVLKVENMSQERGQVEDINFEIHKGEVLGLAGVLGSGRTEVGKMVFGALRKKNGCRLHLKNRILQIHSPKDAVRHRMAFISEDRKTEGLIVEASFHNNIVLAQLVCQKGSWVNHRKLRAAAIKIGDFMKLKYSDMNQPVKSLSGGNQQKVVLCKWMANDIDLMIMDQPTRGIDVGAKSEIYELVDELARNGKAILYISDELEELYRLCDRVLIMKRGRIFSELSNYERQLTKADIFARMVADADSNIKELKL